MNGGDLRFHISRKTFTEDTVRFWIAELGCALRYVHQQGIVHRDVKPDNVLLDAEGHVHLADFVCLHLQSFSVLRSSRPERSLRLLIHQVVDKQVRHLRLPRSRSISWQALQVRGRLVVTRGLVLRVYLQQSPSTISNQYLYKID